MEQEQQLLRVTKGEGAYLLWGKTEKGQSLSLFTLNIWETLNEAIGAPTYGTKYYLEKGRLIHLQTGLDIQESMKRAIQKAQITLNNSPLEKELLTEQLSRLVLEKYGLEQVVKLLEEGHQNIVWVSPPGLGLNSGEARVNIFLRTEEGVLNYAFVATPQLDALQELAPLLGKSGKLSRTTIDNNLVASFLQSPFPTDLNPLQIRERVEKMNQIVNFTPPGFGIDIYQLCSQYPQIFGALEEEMKEFYFTSRTLPLEERYSNELGFLKHLLDFYVEPVLRHILQQQGMSEEKFLLEYNTLMNRVSSCGQGLGSLINPTNPFYHMNLLASNLLSNEEKKRGCSHYSPPRRKKSRPEQWTP